MQGKGEDANNDLLECYSMGSVVMGHCPGRVSSIPDVRNLQVEPDLFPAMTGRASSHGISHGEDEALTQEAAKDADKVGYKECENPEAAKRVQEEETQNKQRHVSWLVSRSRS